MQGTSKTGVLARIKGLFGAQDMTVGKPMTNILRFAIPLLIGNLAQQLYSTVDSIIVGNYVGTEALSAIGVSNPIVNLLLVLFMAISTGASILVAQYFGAKDKDGLGKSIGTSVTLIFAASVVITVAGVILAGPLLRLINTPDVYFDWAKDYLTIIYGHRMKDGSMFASLLNYFSEATYYEKYPTIELYTPAANYDMVIVSGAKVDSHDASVYSFGDFSPEQRQEYANMVMAANRIVGYTGEAQLDGTERLVLLSTCTPQSDDMRFVIWGMLTPME